MAAARPAFAVDAARRPMHRRRPIRFRRRTGPRPRHWSSHHSRPTREPEPRQPTWSPGQRHPKRKHPRSMNRYHRFPMHPSVPWKGSTRTSCVADRNPVGVADAGHPTTASCLRSPTHRPTDAEREPHRPPRQEPTRSLRLLRQQRPGYPSHQRARLRRTMSGPTWGSGWPHRRSDGAPRPNVRTVQRHGQSDATDSMSRDRDPTVDWPAAEAARVRRSVPRRLSTSWSRAMSSSRRPRPIRCRRHAMHRRPIVRHRPCRAHRRT